VAERTNFGSVRLAILLAVLVFVALNHTPDGGQVAPDSTGQPLEQMTVGPVTAREIGWLR